MAWDLLPTGMKAGWPLTQTYLPCRIDLDHGALILTPKETGDGLFCFKPDLTHSGWVNLLEIRLGTGFLGLKQTWY